MTDRIEDLMEDLMRDVYVALEDPSAILDAVPAEPEPEPQVATYTIAIPRDDPSHEPRVYHAGDLSRSRVRNTKLYLLAMRDLSKAPAEGPERDAIRAFLKALIDVL